MNFFNQMLLGFQKIFESPIINLNVLWLIVPLFLVWVILVVYFGVFSKERIGWDDVLTNGVSTGWVMASLLAFLFSQPSKDWIRILVIIGLLVYSLALVVMSFKRNLPEGIAFIIASPTMIFFISFVAVVWSYDSLKMTWPVFVDLFIIFVILMGAVEGLLEIRRRKHSSSASEDSDEDLEELEELEEPLPE